MSRPTAEGEAAVLPRALLRLAIAALLVVAVPAAAETRGGAASGSAAAGAPGAAAAAGEGVVELTVVGSAADLRRLREIVEPDRSTSSKLRWARTERVDPAEILRTDRDAAAPAVRCWIDLLQARRARLYFSARSGRQFLVRDLELSGTFNELDKEALSQVIELSVSALLENERAGITRAEAESVLAARARVEAPPVAPSPTLVEVHAPPPPRAPSFAAGVGYGVRAVGGSAPLVHGPGAWVSRRLRGERPALGLWLGGDYQLPQRDTGPLVSMRFETLALRAGLELRLPFGGAGSGGGAGRAELRARVGAGADFVRISPQAGTVDPTAALTSARWSRALALSASLGAGWTVGRRLLLGAHLFVDVLPTSVHYDVVVSGNTSTAFDPWRFRPGLALEAALP